MRWRPRLFRGRLRDQAAVVLVVAVVAVAATTLVGVLAGLLNVAETRAVPEALDRLDPAQVRIESTLWVGGEDVGPVLEDARAGIAEITGDVPTTDETWLIGSIHALPKAPDATQPELTYLASLPHDAATLLTGRWPDRAVDDDGRVEVNVPAVAAEARGWEVGATIDARDWDTTEYRTWVVVGTHEAARPLGAWSRDRLWGRGIQPGFNVPGGAGMFTTTAWGPLVVDPAALAGPEKVDTAYLLTYPQLADASDAAIAELRAEMRDGSETLAAALGDVGGRLVTDVDDTIDATWRELVVTRAAVITIGLLLATLAAAVMLLTARLLAERRAVESELLAARGASPRQLRSLVVLEALALAGVTWLVSPWLAGLVLDLASRSGLLADAGYAMDPGVPDGALLACAAMAGVLAVTLCVPAWHTAGSTTGTAHAGILRVGGDVALLALGGLAMWQLVVYGSPLTGGVDGPRIDPVLVAGPALVTLAAATVALRAVAPVARVGERLAGRARSFVVPLAAWQVARRSSVTTGTVLVVTIAVTAGTFATGFAATWRTSQVEQVNLALGTDLRADEITDPALTASAMFAEATAAHDDAHGQPVVNRPISLGPRGNSAGVSARLVAVDASRPQDLRGHGAVPWGAVVDELAESQPALDAGTPLPPDSQWLVVEGTVGTLEGTTGKALVGVTVEDERGVLTQLGPRSTLLGASEPLVYEIPPAGRGTLRVVAVDALVTVEELAPDLVFALERSGGTGVMLAPVELSITGVRTVARSEGIRFASEVPDAPSTAVAVDVGGWSAGLHQEDRIFLAEVESTMSTPAGSLDLQSNMEVNPWSSAPARLVARAWPAQGSVPVVASHALHDRLDGTARALTMSINGVNVHARVVRYVDHVPGAPRGIAILADHTTLTRAVLESGGPPGMVDAWWVAAPAATSATVAAGLTDVDAVVRTRAGEQDKALTGPISVAVPVALSLVGFSAALLVLIGAGSVAAASVRARRLELARLQAIGASRPGLVGGLLAESTVLVVVGALSGMLAGYGLAAVVAPLLTMSPDGRTPAPDPWLVWVWGDQALQTFAVAAGASAVVAAVVVAGVRRTSGAALRMGDDR
ncbi:MAG: hypothetical protein IR158_14280 [Cellulomonas sp.]|uniref:FtsX-like permease family protein n=1 Tax=Cellulomonas sp. TaxID=40001 RepID=UPI0019DA9BA6|nr:FtsX-like permease family protein [Cellulomonas sp.]MBF0688920.1 hypothetical protein [Cellulomonas sp.]